MGALIAIEPNRAVSTELADLADTARRFAHASRSANTIRAYSASWRSWTAWCDRHGACPLPARPEVVALYVSDLAQQGRKLSTIRLHIAAISAAHKDSDLDFERTRPLRSVMTGIAREIGDCPKKKTPLIRDNFDRLYETIDRTTMVGKRDWAILLIGFGAALRRSELAALRVSDINVTDKGLEVTIRRSKTDQTGQGCVIAVAKGRGDVCPVAAFKDWIAAAGLKGEDALFQRLSRAGRCLGGISDRSIAAIVKSRTAAAGIEGDFSGHSLRRGLLTSAAINGSDLISIMRQSRHKSERVARGYIDVADRWRGNVTATLF